MSSTQISEAPATMKKRHGRALSISVAQISPVLGDRQRNVEMHLKFIHEAKSQEADLIVFPELSLTGYFLRDMVPDVACSVDSPDIRKLVQAAAPADLVLGFAEESTQHRYFNSALYASGGQITHLHRKVYLPTYGLFEEQRYFASGNRIRAFDTTRFGRVGLLVCEDFWHLSSIAIMQAEEVDVLICAANSPARGVSGETVATSESYTRMARTYAELLGALVIVSNRVGFEDGLCFWGGSMAVGPGGETLASGPHFDEALVTATFDPADLRRGRLRAPLARDERLLLTIEELQRIKRQQYED